MNTMKIKAIFCMLVLLQNLKGQVIREYDTLGTDLWNYVVNTNKRIEKRLVSGQGFNVFMQRKISYYLTGSSEISISKAFATYSSEDDKLTFGINIKDIRKDRRLRSLFNPLLEAGIKEGFSTFYKKGEWQSDIRMGFKYVYFSGNSTINFYGMEHLKNQQSEMIRKRGEKGQEILKKIKKDREAWLEAPDSLIIKSRDSLTAIYTKEREQTEIAIKKLNENNLTKKQRKKKEKLQKDLKDFNAVIAAARVLTVKDSTDLIKNIRAQLDEYKQEIAEMEADALYKEHLYTWSRTSWVAIWGFYPLTESEHYMATDQTTPFANKLFNPWEINLQANSLWDNSYGALYLALGGKVFQNNSALADLMNSVDYNQYVQFPGTDTLNSAIIESDKAFMGAYKEFTSTNLNIQVVLSLSDEKKEGGARFCTPALSIRFEQNFGDYSATNLRFGIPLKFRGEDKDKAVNVEPQIRLNDVANYSGKKNYKIQPIIGISVGLPFAALFK